MRWFGADWGAPVCDADTHAPTPVGEPCVPCGKPIMAGDRGFLIPQSSTTWGETHVMIEYRPWHLACMMESVLGPEWESILTGTVEGERILRGGP